MQQNMDISCIKQERQEDYEVPEYAMDIGPIKIEEPPDREIKEEWNEAQQTINSFESESHGQFNQTIPVAVTASPQASSVETKSNNRRTVVNELRERLMKVDMASSKLNKAKPYFSTQAHMRDLRQRLMNLERSKELSQKKPMLTSSQQRRELHQRPLHKEQGEIKPVEQKTEEKNKSESCKYQPCRFSLKSSAQPMQELHQRRLQQLSQQDKNCNNNSSSSLRPRTPPELSVNRMREFRQRLLKLDKSCLEIKSNKEKMDSKRKNDKN